MTAKKLKVLFICNSPFISGAELSVITLIHKMNTIESLVFAHNKLRLNEKFPGIPIHTMPFIWYKLSFNPSYLFRCLLNYMYVALIFIIKCRNNNFDIIYSNSVKSFIYGVFVKIITGKPHICHIRDNVNNPFLKKQIVKHSDLLICISRHVSMQFENVKHKVLLYSGIDIGRVTAKESGVRNELGITSNDILIANIGQVTKWKNQTDFVKSAIEIIKSTDNTYFIIVGDDLSGKESAYKKKILNIISAPELNSRIKFMGWHEKIYDIISSIDILVHTAIGEPFGRVLIESMILKKPIVAFNSGGPSEIILNNVTGFLVEPLNISELTNKIFELIYNDKIRLRFGIAGEQRVLEKFNFDKNIGGFEAAFQKLFNKQQLF